MRIVPLIVPAVLVAFAASAESLVAREGSPAVVSLGMAAPLPPDRQRSLLVMLRAYQPPTTGSAVAVVSLRETGSPGSVEVGRFSVYPATAFQAQTEADVQSFQFDVTRVVPAGGGGDWAAEIRLEPLQQNTLAGAQMVFGGVRLVVVPR